MFNVSAVITGAEQSLKSGEPFKIISEGYHKGYSLR